MRLSPLTALLLTLGLVISLAAPARAQSSAFAWEPWSGQVPPGAVAAGYDDVQHVPLFVCHGPYNGGLHPGKLIFGHCNIGWGGNEVVLDNFELLVQVGNGSWQLDGRDPAPNTVVGGYENGGPLFVCVANYQGRHPGKVVAGRCNIGWGGREVVIDDYQLLVAY